MPEFLYKAINKQGENVTGKIDAQNEGAAKYMLEDAQGLTSIELDEIAKESVTWKINMDKVPIGLKHRIERFYIDMLNNNKNILVENFNAEHLALDIADDWGYKRYIYENITFESTSDASFDSFDTVEQISFIDLDTFDTMYSQINSLIIKDIILRDKYGYTRYFLLGVLTLGEISIKVSIPVKEEDNSDRTLISTYSIKPMAVG